jgi:hypothetical protein
MNAQHKINKLANRRRRLIKKAKGKEGLTQQQKQRLDALNA